MKAKAKSKSPKPAKLADLGVKKDPKGGGQKRETTKRQSWQNHNETFLAAE
jgi:hypothetical protein